jgi:hypothetical protein
MSISERARPLRKLCDHCPAHRRRSLPQHKRMFGLIAAAFHHWPEGHEFEPDSAEHLRAWLLCKTRHREAADFTIPETDDPVMMARLMEFAEALLNVGDDSKFGRWRGSTLRVYTPKSISFEKLNHRDACKLFDEIGAVIETEMGIAPDELLKQTEAAA